MLNFNRKLNVGRKIVGLFFICSSLLTIIKYSLLKKKQIYD